MCDCGTDYRKESGLYTTRAEVEKNRMKLEKEFGSIENYYSYLAKLDIQQKIFEELNDIPKRIEKLKKQIESLHTQEWNLVRQLNDIKHSIATHDRGNKENSPPDIAKAFDLPI